jgi:hypothetical protein
MGRMFTVWVYKLQDMKRKMADWINFATQLSSSVESSKQKNMVITTCVVMLPQFNCKESTPLSCQSNKNIKNMGAMQHMI